MFYFAANNPEEGTSLEAEKLAKTSSPLGDGGAITQIEAQTKSAPSSEAVPEVAIEAVQNNPEKFGNGTEEGENLVQSTQRQESIKSGLNNLLASDSESVQNFAKMESFKAETAFPQRPPIRPHELVEVKKLDPNQADPFICFTVVVLVFIMYFFL